MAENGHQYAEIFNRVGETLLETTKHIAEINVKTGERLFEQQAELASQWVNAATRNVDLATKAIGYQELFTGQAQIAQDYSQQLLQSYRRAAEVWSDASKQVAAAVEQAARTTTEETKRSVRQTAARE